ncbi:MAG TPA: addiction module protein, partial [Bacteroidia bacterium]|nr:addiction module protein [Bacteroidia bacterium]
MGTEFASLFELERAERLQLVEDLWDSLADEGSPLPVAEWKAEELRRRWWTADGEWAAEAGAYATAEEYLS